MDQQEQNEEKPKRHSHKWLWGVAIIAGLVLLLFLLLPSILSTSGGTRFVESRLSSAVDGSVSMGDLSVGWFGGVKVSDFVFEGPDGATRLQASRISSNPRYWSLLSGRLALGDTVIDSPDVRLTVTKQGEIKGLSDEQEEEDKPGQKMQIGPLDLKVSDGRALIRQATGENQYEQVEFRNIASTVSVQSGGKASSLALSMGVAADGQAETTGTVEANGEMQSADGGFSLEGLSGQFEVEVSSLALESLKPLLALADVEVDLGGTLNANAQLKITDGDLETLVADARVDNFRQTVGGETIDLQEPITAQARIVTREGDYVIEQLQVQSAFLTLDGTGGVNQFDYTMQANLGQTQAVLGPLAGLEEYDVQGRLSGSGVVRFQDEQITSTGQMQVQQFVLVHDQNEIGPTPLEFVYEATVDPERQTAQVSNASLRFVPGTIQVRNGSVNWAGEQAQADVRIRGEVNLQQARPYVNFFYPLPEDIEIAGMAQPDLQVQMDGGRLTVRAGNTRIENLRVSQPDTEPFVSREVTVGGRAVLDLENNQLEELSDFTLTGDQIQIRGNLQREDQPEEMTKVSGHVEAGYDLQAVGDLISPFVPETLVLMGRRQDFFDFVSVYPRDEPEKLLASLNGTGKFGFDSARYIGMDIGAANFDVIVRDGLLSLNLPELPVNNGIVQIAGNVNLAEDPMFFRLEKAMPLVRSVRINETMTNTVIKYFNPAFAQSTDVSGIASLTCQELEVPLGGASMEELLVVGTLWVEEINMNPGAFWKDLLLLIKSPTAASMNIAETHFVVRDGVLHYERMEVDVDDKPFIFAGDIGITTDQLDLKVQLPFTTEGRTIKRGERERGRPLAGRVKGTVDEPELDLAQSVLDTLGGTVEGILKGLGDIFD